MAEDPTSRGLWSLVHRAGLRAWVRRHSHFGPTHQVPEFSCEIHFTSPLPLDSQLLSRCSLTVGRGREAGRVLLRERGRPWREDAECGCGPAERPPSPAARSPWGNAAATSTCSGKSHLLFSREGLVERGKGRRAGKAVLPRLFWEYSCTCFHSK